MSYKPRLLDVRDEAAAGREILGIRCDPLDTERLAAKMLGRCIKLTGVPCSVANILKQQMLLLGGDAALARESAACAMPQTNVLLIGTHRQLRQLCTRLVTQPAELHLLGEELRLLLRHLDTPATFLDGFGCRLDLTRPRIMGILNVTPDSFSDGGRFSSVERALEHGRSMAEEGADLIDVGGESTRPGAPVVSVQEEIDRVVPVIEALVRDIGLPVSVDTSKSRVARAAVTAGAAFINDISGLQFDPQMAAVAAESGAGLFLMHTRGRPAEMQADTRYGDLVGEILDYLQQGIDLACAAGVTLERIAVDPGIGFAKSAEGNLELLRRLPELLCLGRPVLLGTSRKGFIGKVLNQPHPQDRLFGTLATVALGVERGAKMFRVHDVRAAVEAARLSWAICDPRGAHHS